MWLRAEGYGVAAFRSAEAFLSADDPQQPGCLVIDLRLAPRGQMPRRAVLAAELGRPAVLVSGDGDVTAAVEAMKAGAVDFLVKPFEPGAFLAAVRRALAKDGHERAVRRELESVRGRLATLTPREHEVLDQVVIGRLNKQIAAALGITEKTIKVHRGRAMQKMGVSTVAELVRKTLELELGTVIHASRSGDGAPGR